MLASPAASAMGFRLVSATFLVAAVLLPSAAHGGGEDRLTFLIDAPDGPPPIRATVDGEERPVLFGTSGFPRSEDGVVPPSREVVLRLGMPLTPRRAEMIEVRAVAVVRDRVRPSVSYVAADDGARVRVAFEPDEVGAPYKLILVEGWAPPPGRRVTIVGPVAVPPGARLRVGLAVEADRCAEQPLAEVGIDAVVGRRGRPLFRRRLDPRAACASWTDVELPLAGVAGERVAFRFRARAARGEDRARRLHVLWADPTLVTPRTDGEPPPNVILISLDTLGARHVGAYGYPYPTTPRLDALAAEGALFTSVVSHYPSTPASHMTMLTGLLPRAHGVRRFGDRLPDRVRTLAELLRTAGYTTAAVTEDGVLSREMGFSRGFHVYRETRYPDRSRPHPGHHPLGHLRGMARQTFRIGLRWLEPPPEPFFLFLHTYEVHLPFLPTPSLMRAVRRGQADGDGEDLAREYDAEVRFLDGVVGFLVERLRRAGLLDRTVLIVTSDHGEAFGEHGAWYHQTMLYDEVMRVPLLLSGPRIPRGTVVRAPVGLVDVAPTVLELAGVTAAELHGRSLLPAVRGAPPAPRPLVAEVRGILFPDPGSDPDLRAVWLGDRKAILDLKTRRWEVYDLAADAAERHDVAASSGATIRDAEGVLGWYEGLGADAVDRAAPTPAIEAGQRERLRALGYAQ